MISELLYIDGQLRMSFTRSAAFTRLTSHKQRFTAPNALQTLFAEDSERVKRYAYSVSGIDFDLSKQWIDEDIHQELVALAESCQLPERIQQLFSGAVVNPSEGRPALHTALRGIIADELRGSEIESVIGDTLQRMREFVASVHNNEFVGHTGKPLRTIVNIGIGGSYLGPKVVSDALAPYAIAGFDLHYIANIDPTDATDVLAKLDPETTLFVICSKSFSTLETLENAKACRRWFLANGGAENDIAQHFIAVTTAIEKATAFGINPDNLFPMWDWVGGRYSLWSAIGLPQALYLGMETFEALLAGAHEMDVHFAQAPLAENVPVLSAMLGVWYQNVHGAGSHAVLAYDQRLAELPNHLQQVDMESNGKSATLGGHEVTYDTGGVIWGGVGTNGQHAYHQLLHQGTRLVPVDFLVAWQSHNDIDHQHQWLVANCLAQAQAMLLGRDSSSVRAELANKGLTEQEVEALVPHKVIPGNRPSSLISFNKLTPKVLGALIAFYEHRIYVQSVVWQTNAFDQWGVELGKVMGDVIFQALEGEAATLDPSTAAAVTAYRAAQQAG